MLKRSSKIRGGMFVAIALLASVLAAGVTPTRSADAQVPGASEAEGPLLGEKIRAELYAALGPAPRIVNGQDADPFEYPTIAALVMPWSDDEFAFCGGTAIGATWILTAAHCVDDQPASPSLDVILGAWALDLDLGHRIAVCDVTVHPSWDTGTNLNDIALLELCEPHHHPTAQLPASSSLDSTGTNVDIPGWGYIDSAGINPAVLQEINVPILNKSTCESQWFFYDHASQVCAGNSVDSCSGDSGGPMYVGDVIVGLVSYGDFPCELSRAGVYTRVHTFNTWITGITGVAPGTSLVGIPCEMGFGSNARYATELGTSGPDDMVGTSRGDVFVTYGGDDTVTQSTGFNTTCLGDGDDKYVGGDGIDSVKGEAGEDTFRGNDDFDFFIGGNGDDLGYGGDGGDWLYGGRANDKLRGQAGDDWIDGEAGEDDVNGGSDDDNVFGGDDNDVAVRGGTGDDMVDGGDGNDALVAGNGGEDTVLGGTGNDVVNGGPRPDILHGGNGNDVMKGNGGADTMSGDGGNDELFGGPQSDTLDGGSGTGDYCNGGTEPDTAVGCETTDNI